MNKYRFTRERAVLQAKEVESLVVRGGLLDLEWL